MCWIRALYLLVVHMVPSESVGCIDVMYFATYLYIIKDNSLVGQNRFFKVTRQMAWFVVSSLFVVSMT